MLVNPASQRDGERERSWGLDIPCRQKKNALFRNCFPSAMPFLSAVPEIRRHSERELRGRGSWKVRRQQHNPYTVKYLQYAWGVGVNYANNLLSLEHNVYCIDNENASIKQETQERDR